MSTLNHTLLGQRLTETFNELLESYIDEPPQRQTFSRDVIGVINEEISGIIASPSNYVDFFKSALQALQDLNLLKNELLHPTSPELATEYERLITQVLIHIEETRDLLYAKLIDELIKKEKKGELRHISIKDFAALISSEGFINNESKILTDRFLDRILSCYNKNQVNTLAQALEILNRNNYCPDPFEDSEEDIQEHLRKYDYNRVNVVLKIENRINDLEGKPLSPLYSDDATQAGAGAAAGSTDHHSKEQQQEDIEVRRVSEDEFPTTLEKILNCTLTEKIKVDLTVLLSEASVTNLLNAIEIIGEKLDSSPCTFPTPVKKFYEGVIEKLHLQKQAFLEINGYIDASSTPLPPRLSPVAGKGTGGATESKGQERSPRSQVAAMAMYHLLTPRPQTRRRDAAPAGDLDLD